MRTRFEAAHEDDIVGRVTTVDRWIVRGHLSRFWYPRAFHRFLLSQGLRMADFGRCVRQATEKVRAHAEQIAKAAGRPWQHFDATVRGKDELARGIALRDGIKEGLICVFSAMELAKCFAVVGGAIVPRRRKCLHFYFYLIDRDLGFMHVRIQSWFPFQIQVYLNGRECLARQLDRRGIGYERYENTFLRIDDMPAALRLTMPSTTLTHRENAIGKLSEARRIEFAHRHMPRLAFK